MDDRQRGFATLDCRVRLLWFLVFLISLFVPGNTASLIFSSVSLFLAVLLSKADRKRVTHRLSSLIPLFLFFSLLVYLTEGGEMRKALVTFSRLLLSVVSSNFLMSVTSGSDIAEAIDRIFSHFPFRKASRRFSLAMMTAFSFIPVLQAEGKRIMEAQRCRGASFEGRGLHGKARSWLPVVVPLFVSAFRRADELALALDARGFNENGATSLYTPVYTKKDAAAYILLLLYIAVVIILGRFQWK